MELPDLNHLSPEDKRLVLESHQKAIQEFQIDNEIVSLESYADILDKVGMHIEARKYFQNIYSKTQDIPTQARCWRKIAFSFNSQRDFMSADTAAENANKLLNKLLIKDKTANEEYVRILQNSAQSYYFQLKFEKLDATVKEVKRFLPDLNDIELRFNLFQVISIAMFPKYRWYQLPEEAFTHLELQLQLTSQLEDKFYQGYTHCVLGHFYMFNEEFVLSREHFSKGIKLLQGKHFGPLLIAYNYTAVGYRMQNNVSMTEQWALLTLEKAKQSANYSYEPMSYANLAWVNAKRNNWLYAEDYARKAAANWATTGLTYLYALPLIECLLLKQQLDEAGELTFKLLHPRLKKLPDSLTGKMKTTVKTWFSGNNSEFASALKETIDEAKLTGYY